MDCTWIARDEIFEQYVRDALSPEERDAFEDHFFACEACFDRLQTYQALRAELRASVVVAPPEKFARTWPWRWALVPAVGGATLVAVLTLWPRSPGPPAASPTTVVATPQSLAVAPPPQPRLTPAKPGQDVHSPVTGPTKPPAPAAVLALSVLARVEAPVFLPVALRGPRDEAAARFEAAMGRYVDGDYTGAIPGLIAATELNPKAAYATFFLAICHLLTGQIDPAIERLQKTISLGESPYLEEAHFYLAKARLSQRDVPAARDQLRLTIAQRGRLERDARQLLAQLDSLPAGKDRPPRN